MSCFYVLRESDFLRDFQSQSYPWSPNCLENFSEILENSWISIKVKNFKTFSSPNQRASLRKFLVPLPDKSFLLLWNKGFLMEIYKNIQTFAFEVLRKCSSWASRNGAVQMFFWHEPETVCRKIEWVEVRKMSEIFWGNLYCKMSDLFLLLLFVLRLSTRKSEINR